MNFMFLDIERAPKHTYTHELYNTTIPYYKIKQDAFVISASWSFNREKKIHSVSIMDDVKRFINDHTDDYHVIKTLRDEISKADYIVGHYIKGFDWKVIHGGIMYHRLQPIKKPKLIDTLEEARKAKYSSNKLDFLAKKFGFDGKLEHRRDMLELCSEGDVKAIRECLRYNKGDINPMRKLYYHFRPYTLTKQYPDKCDGVHCPYCERKTIVKNGSKRGKQKYFCNHCFKCSTGD